MRSARAADRPAAVRPLTGCRARSSSDRRRSASRCSSAPRLLVRSAIGLWTADAGFDPAPLLSARIYLAGDQSDPPLAKVQVLET